MADGSSLVFQTIWSSQVYPDLRFFPQSVISHVDGSVHLLSGAESDKWNHFAGLNFYPLGWRYPLPYMSSRTSLEVKLWFGNIGGRISNKQGTTCFLRVRKWSGRGAPPSKGSLPMLADTWEQEAPCRIQNFLIPFRQHFMIHCCHSNSCQPFKSLLDCRIQLLSPRKYCST